MNHNIIHYCAHSGAPNFLASHQTRFRSICAVCFCYNNTIPIKYERGELNIDSSAPILHHTPAASHLFKAYILTGNTDCIILLHAHTHKTSTHLNAGHATHKPHTTFSWTGTKSLLPHIHVKNWGQMKVTKGMSVSVHKMSPPTETSSSGRRTNGTQGQSRSKAQSVNKTSNQSRFFELLQWCVGRDSKNVGQIRDKVSKIDHGNWQFLLRVGPDLPLKQFQTRFSWSRALNWSSSRISSSRGEKTALQAKVHQCKEVGRWPTTDRRPSRDQVVFESHRRHVVAEFQGKH